MKTIKTHLKERLSIECNPCFYCEDVEYSTYEKNVPAPIFRKSLQLKAEVKQAKVQICGLGFYDLFVNGEKITKGLLAPYVSNPDHYLYYDEYEISSYLKSGENVIGIMLGDGYLVGKTKSWDFKDKLTNAAPMLCILVEIEYADEIDYYFTEDFVCKKGPILFNDMRSGIFYDARREEQGWQSPGFQEEGWQEPLKVGRLRGTMRLCQAEPIRVYREISPVSIRAGEMEPEVYTHDETIGFVSQIEPFETAIPCTGGYIFDFGENNTGIYRLKIKGERGQRIDIQCAEQLTDGKLNCNNINFYPHGFAQRDIYYLSGAGEEVFEPMFTYHGYRYLYVTGITAEQATEDLLTYLVISSDLEERGTFACSDEMANQIFAMGRRSDRSNFIYFPLDCPHREKNGWTGDAAVSAEHMIMTMATERSWQEWLYSIRAAQKEDGEIPGIIPGDNWGFYNGPAWDRVIFLLPYYAWKYRGETKIIEENAAAMLRYLEFIAKKRDASGIVRYGLGDWCAVGKENAHEYDADLGFLNGVVIVDFCRKAAQMFAAVGLHLHKTFAEQLGNEMLESVRKEYLNLDTYVVKKECQTSQAMALFYDIFQEEEKQKGFEVLLEIIKRDGNSFTCGILGMRGLFHVLSMFGQSELAYDMITKSEFPSYGWLIKQGETTLPEVFFQTEGELFKWSKNHHFMGDVVNWFMSRIGGLQVEGPDYVKVHPAYIKQLDWCRTTHKLPGGTMEVFWERKNGEIDLQVKCTGTVRYEIV